MRSSFETAIDKLLKLEKVSFKYEACKIPYTLFLDYIPDFKIGDMFIEAKGYLRPEDRRKLLAVKQSNPDLDLRIWFQKDNYLTKSKKSKYSDWARKNGFKYHVGLTLPEDWIK